MEKTTRIIECFGMPGCGKSTLCEGLLSSHVYRFGRLSDLTDEFRKESFFFQCTHLPFICWFRLILFLLTVRGKRKNSWGFYRPFFTISLAYKYCRYNHSYDYLVVDHGLIQCLVSMLHNLNYSISTKTKKAFLSFIHKVGIDYSIYCQVQADEALSRIQRRHRDSGRIDAIVNDRTLAKEFLQKEERVFSDIALGIGRSLIALDMSRPESELVDIVISCLN